jgi:hypothetical protein
MKPRKNFILIMLLGLLLAAFAAVAVAQTPAPSDDKKKAESCCSAEAKDSCCGCCDESCDMEKHDANMKHDKDHKGDCCKMKQKDKTKEKKVA